MPGGVTGGTTDRGYKCYVALLTQSETNAPVATVLENTLGGTVVWTRIGAGVYRGTLAGAFPANKVWFSVQVANASGDLTAIVHPTRTDNDRVTLVQSDFTATPMDGFSGISAEIRVYP